MSLIGALRTAIVDFLSGALPHHAADVPVGFNAGQAPSTRYDSGGTRPAYSSSTCKHHTKSSGRDSYNIVVSKELTTFVAELRQLDVIREATQFDFGKLNPSGW